MARQVAAIDRGDISWVQRAQVTSIVPVEKMSTVTGKRLHDVQCGLQTLGGIERTQPSKIPGGQSGQQIEPHVGGRGAMRDDGLRGFLKIVRWQPVVASGDEGFEEAPGPSRDQAQFTCFGIRQRRLMFKAPRPTDPGGDSWRCQPQQTCQQCHRPGLGRLDHDTQCGGQCQQCPRRHTAIEAGQRQSRATG